MGAPGRRVEEELRIRVRQLAAVAELGQRAREIGEVLGVTESRVSQLHTKAILRLKARLAGSPAREPLGR